MDYLESKFFLLAITFGSFFLAKLLQKKTGLLILNPILIAIAMLICFLKFTDISYEKLVYLQNHKTGALIKAACLMGNIAGGGHYENILESYAENIGLAFQIRDDVLDVESTEDVLGKPIGSDEKSHKSTFVTHFGTEKAKETVTELSEKAAASVENINEYGAALAYLARKLAKRSK